MGCGLLLDVETWHTDHGGFWLRSFRKFAAGAKKSQAAKSKAPFASSLPSINSHILAPTYYIYIYLYTHTPVIPPVIPSLKSWVLSHGTINPTHTLCPAPCAMFLHLGVLVLADLAEGGLVGSRWQRVPTGAVEPQGWLKMQMTLCLACTRAYYVLVFVCHLRLHIWSVPPGVFVGRKHCGFV